MEGNSAAAPSSSPNSVPNSEVNSESESVNRQPEDPRFREGVGTQGTSNNKSNVKQPGSPPPIKAPEYIEKKINGKSVRLTRDQWDEFGSLGYAADSRFKEAARIKEEYSKKEEESKGMLKTPMKLLMARGYSREEARQIIEDDYHSEILVPESLTEDQRKVRSLEEENKRYKDSEAKLIEQHEKEQFQKAVEHHRNRLDLDILETMKAGNFPKTPEYAKRIAFYMRESLQNNYDAPKETIIRKVRNEMTGGFKNIIDNSSVPELIEILGEKTMNEIRRHDIDQFRQKRGLNPMKSPETSRRAAGTGPMDNDRIYSSEVDRRLREMRTKGF